MDIKTSENSQNSLLFMNALILSWGLLLNQLQHLHVFNSKELYDEYHGYDYLYMRDLKYENGIICVRRKEILLYVHVG